MKAVSGNEQRLAKPLKIGPTEVENITQGLKESTMTDISSQSLVGMPEGKSAKPRRMKHREVKEETKTGEGTSQVLYSLADRDCSQNKT